MAGYYGYSMSNNAVEAYKSGEKPYSKWKKADIIQAINQLIESEELELKCDINNLFALNVNLLKKLALCQSSWHHTSSWYNHTDFYSIDSDYLSDLSNGDIEQLKKQYSQSTEINDNSKSNGEKWECAFLEWSGTRNHPKSTEIVEIGIVKNNWFYRSNGSKKKTTANGFRFIRKIQEV